MLEAIVNFLSKLVNDYLPFTLLGILLLIVIVFLSILLHSKRKREMAKLQREEFKQESVQSLTPEEIDNISNNSANPEEVKQYLTTEVEEVKQQAVKKSEEEKAKKQQKTTTKTTPKKEVKVEAQPTTKKSTDKAEEKPVERKTTAKKTAEKEVKVEKKPTTKRISKAEEKPVEKKATSKTTIKKEVKVEEKPTTKKISKAEEKPATKSSKTVSKKEEKPVAKKQYTGKWKIIQGEDGWYAVLTASNGGTLLKTEMYKSVSNVKNGIETIKKNIDGGNFAISIDKYGHYRFKLFNLSNRLICVSEDYSSKAKCESGIESVKRFAKTASIIQEDK